MEDPENLSDELEEDDFDDEWEDITDRESDESDVGDRENYSDQESMDWYSDDDTSSQDSSRNVFDKIIFAGVITKEVVKALDEKNRAQSQKNLKDWCVDTIMKNKNFFVNFQGALFLPECLLTRLREALFEKEENVDMQSCCLFSSLIDASTTTSVRFRGCNLPGVPETIFWKAIQEASNLKRLSYLGEDPSTSILGLISQLQKLQVIDIPNLKCGNKHLVFIATHFPALQELTVSLKAGIVSARGAEALSQLKHFRKFTFKTCDSASNFAESCMMFMPTLRRLGTATTTTPDHKLYWDYCHPVQLMQQPAVLALEALVLNASCFVPETTSLPNLRELYVDKPDSSLLPTIVKFQGLTHLCVTTRARFEIVLEILQVVGANLKSVSIEEECSEICLDTILELCPEVEFLAVWARFKKQPLRKRGKRKLKLKELQLDPGALDVAGMAFENSALMDILLDSNSTLRVLKLSYAADVVSQEAQHLAWFAEQQLIFQHLEDITFVHAATREVLALLAQLALSCPRLTKIKLPLFRNVDLFVNSYLYAKWHKC